MISAFALIFYMTQKKNCRFLFVFRFRCWYWHETNSEAKKYRENETNVFDSMVLNNFVPSMRLEKCEKISTIYIYSILLVPKCETMWKKKGTQKSTWKKRKKENQIHDMRIIKKSGSLDAGILAAPRSPREIDIWTQNVLGLFVLNFIWNFYLKVLYFFSSSMFFSLKLNANTNTEAIFCVIFDSMVFCKAQFIDWKMAMVDDDDDMYHQRSSSSPQWSSYSSTVQHLITR